MPSLSLDYRSDTVTQPTAAMREAMAAAEVGDDVFGDDPTVNRLQDQVARLLGKEAALFMPTGTMTNQVAICCHCQPGDSFLCEEQSHVYYYEQGAFARFGGVVAQTVPGQRGVMQLDALEQRVFAGGDHQVRTRLLELENTHNRAGGAIVPLETVQSLTAWAAEQGLARHLDGARLFNAVVATGVPARTWADCFDTVSVCFSKGLGAPVGSCLAGSAEFMQRARRMRKCFGGGMRQAGVLAAAALHALEHHVERLADDHAHAQRLAEQLREIEGLSIDPADPQTNIVMIDISPALGTAADLAERLKQRGVLMLPIARQRLRAVTHLDTPTEGADIAAGAIAEVVAALRVQRPKNG